jgi:hypothetical protein
MDKLKNGHAILASFLFVVATLAFGQDAIPEPPSAAPWYIEFLKNLLGQFPEVNGWIGAILIFLMSLMRGVAEIFAFIAAKTESKKDDEWALIVAKIARWASSIIGWFGLGSPKK